MEDRDCSNSRDLADTIVPQQRVETGTPLEPLLVLAIAARLLLRLSQAQMETTFVTNTSRSASPS